MRILTTYVNTNQRCNVYDIRKYVSYTQLLRYLFERRTQMKLSAYLLKEECDSFEDALRSHEEVGAYDIFDLTEDNNFEVVVILGAARATKPEWLSLFENEIEFEDELYMNKNTRAVVMVKHGNNYIAYTFGHGRHLIKDYAVIKDFGLKSVLNSVNPSKVKGVDKTTVDNIIMNSRQQTVKDIDFSSFTLDSFKDFVKSISGEPYQEDLGTSIAGSDSIHFSYDIEFESLYELTELLIGIYNSEEYKEKFPWYDKMQIVKDKVLRSNLYTDLVQKLINSPDSVDFVLPEVVDGSIGNEFKFTPNGKEFEMNVSSILSYFDEKQNEITYETLANKRVHIFANGEELYNWKLLDCLSSEVERDNRFYLLLSGIWFEIDKDYHTEIDEALSEIKSSSINYIDSRKGEWEERYTIRLADSNSDFLAMDQKFVNGIEVCDMYTIDKQFVHIKPWKSSSTLSHLFSQGRVSAEFMLNDYLFREKVCDLIYEEDNRFSNIDKTNFIPSEYEVVFAIIYKEDVSPADRIPFFSRVNLLHTVEKLQQMNFKVKLDKIKRLAT